MCTEWWDLPKVRLSKIWPPITIQPTWSIEAWLIWTIKISTLPARKSAWAWLAKAATAAANHPESSHSIARTKIKCKIWRAWESRYHWSPWIGIRRVQVQAWLPILTWTKDSVMDPLAVHRQTWDFAAFLGRHLLMCPSSDAKAPLAVITIRSYNFRTRRTRRREET